MAHSEERLINVQDSWAVVQFLADLKNVAGMRKKQNKKNERSKHASIDDWPPSRLNIGFFF